jgi:hypothetical protein
MEPLLTPFIREPHSYTLDFYMKQGGGYGALKKALAMTPDAVIGSTDVVMGDVDR